MKMNRVRRAGILFLFSCVLAAPPVGAATHRPQLRLLGANPLRVQGLHFTPHERVTVRDGAVGVRVRTSRTGAFIARLQGVDRCSASRVLARGQRGDHAVLRLPPAMCPVA